MQTSLLIDELMHQALAVNYIPFCASYLSNSNICYYPFHFCSGQCLACAKQSIFHDSSSFKIFYIK